MKLSELSMHFGKAHDEKYEYLGHLGKGTDVIKAHIWKLKEGEEDLDCAGELFHITVNGRHVLGLGGWNLEETDMFFEKDTARCIEHMVKGQEMKLDWEKGQEDCPWKCFNTCLAVKTNCSHESCAPAHHK